MRKLLILSFLTILYISSAHAQTAPTETAKVEEIKKKTGVDDNLAKIVFQILDAHKKNVNQVMSDANLTDFQKKTKVDALIVARKNELMKNLTMAQLFKLEPLD